MNSGRDHQRVQGVYLEVGHEHHVAGGVELVADGLEEDGAQHRARLGALITMPALHIKDRHLHPETMYFCPCMHTLALDTTSNQQYTVLI